MLQERHKTIRYICIKKYSCNVYILFICILGKLGRFPCNVNTSNPQFCRPLAGTICDIVGLSTLYTYTLQRRRVSTCLNLGEYKATTKSSVITTLICLKSVVINQQLWLFLPLCHYVSFSYSKTLTSGKNNWFW